MVERLEARRLFAATPPTGFVLVETVSLEATNDSPVEFATVEGQDYFLLASGTAKIGKVQNHNSSRYTDAVNFDAKNESQKFSVTCLQEAGRFNFDGLIDADGDDFSWGAYSSDHIYSQLVTADGDTASIKFSDTNYTDNAGTMTVDVYQEVVVHSLTVADNNSPGSSVTSTSPDPDDTALLTVQDANGQASIHISAAVSPNKAAAFSQVLYQVDNEDGSELIHSYLPMTGTDVILPGSFTQNKQWIVKAGIDRNHDGTLSAFEADFQLLAANGPTVVSLEAVRLGGDPGEPAILKARNGPTANVVIVVSGKDSSHNQVTLPSSVIIVRVSPQTLLPVGASFAITVQSTNSSGTVQVTIAGTGFTSAGGPYRLNLDIADGGGFQYLNTVIDIEVP